MSDFQRFRATFDSRTRNIRHEKILIAESDAGTPAARLYRPSPSWPVGALALVAAAGAVLTTGALSSALDGGPGPASTVRIGQKVAGAGSGTAAHAATPPTSAPAAAAAAAPTAEGWQVQVGAFRTALAAERHLHALESAMPELAELAAIHRRRGDLDRIRIDGIEDEPAARELCARLRANGHECFVVRPTS